MPKKLGEILIDNKVITEDQLKEALVIQKNDNVPLGQVLVQLKIATQDQIDKALREQSEQG